MNTSVHWTSREVSILEKTYPIEGISDNLLKMLEPRTRKSINIKASRLGIKQINAFNKHKNMAEYREQLVNRNISVLQEYINNSTPILHKCNLCDTEWSPKPNSILSGQGCPTCNKGFGSKYREENIFPETASIYLLRINTTFGEFCKVGVTSSQNRLVRIYQIKSDIGKDKLLNVEVLIFHRSSGQNILRIEQKILNKYQNLARYISPIYFKGHTELFDITCLDDLYVAITKEILPKNEDF